MARGYFIGEKAVWSTKDKIKSEPVISGLGDCGAQRRLTSIQFSRDEDRSWLIC